MDERLTTTYTTESAPSRQHDLQFDGRPFDGLLQTIGQTSCEVASQRQELVSTADLLLEAYEVDDSFFNAEDNAIGLLLASGLQLRTYETYCKPDKKRQKEIRIADYFAKTLFGPYSEHYAYEGVKKSDQLTADEKLNLHHRYENKDLSLRLANWFQDSDIAREVRYELGVNPDTPENLTITVLSAARYLDCKGMPGAGIESEPASPYMQALYDRGRQFMHDKMADPSDTLPCAYATTLFGERYIVIMEPAARAILEPDFKSADDVVDDLRALIKHEYVHSQGSLKLLDPHNEAAVHIGASLEEYRAEVFSGQRFDLLYPEVYAPMENIEEIKGVSPSAIMKNIPLGGGKDKVQLYGSLIAQVGLGITAELAGLQPKHNLMFQSPQSSRDLNRLCPSNLRKHLLQTLNDEELKVCIDRPNYTSDAAREVTRKYYENIRLKAYDPSLAELPR